MLLYKTARLYALITRLVDTPKNRKLGKDWMALKDLNMKPPRRSGSVVTAVGDCRRRNQHWRLDEKYLARQRRDVIGGKNGVISAASR